MTDTFALGSHGPVAVRVELGGAPGERQLVFSLTIRGVGAGVVFDTVVEEWELALGLAVLHAPRLVVVTLVAAGLTFIRSGFIFEHPSTIVHRCGSCLVARSGVNYLYKVFFYFSVFSSTNESSKKVKRPKVHGVGSTSPRFWRAYFMDVPLRLSLTMWIMQK